MRERRPPRRGCRGSPPTEGPLGDFRIGDLAQARDQLDPLPRVRPESKAPAARALPAARTALQRRELDADRLALARRRDRVGDARIAPQADDLARLDRALQRRQLVDRDLGDRTRSLMTGDRDPVDGRDRDRVAGRRLGGVGGVGGGHVAAAQRGHGRVQPRDRQELERRQHAPVDLPGLDVLAPARGEVDPGVAQHLLLELLLGLQQHLSDRRRVAEERVLALGAEDRGVFELHPAVEDRLRVDQRRAHAGGADLEEHVGFACACRAGSRRAGGARAGPDVPEDGPGEHLHADAQRVQIDLVGARAELPRSLRRRGGGSRGRRPPAESRA